MCVCACVHPSSQCVVESFITTTSQAHLHRKTVITCKRRGAKHCVTNDPNAFLWKQTIFGYVFTCETQTPRLIKFRTIEHVGELTQSTKNGWNQLTGGGPTYRWNITSKTFPCNHTSHLYLNLYLFFLCASTDQRARPVLHAQWLKRRHLL
jgi:hypothetical protein